MSKRKGVMETLSLETIPEPGVTLHIDQTNEDSPPDESMSGSSRKKSKTRKKKKKREEALCEEEKTLDVAGKTTNEDLCQQAQDSGEKPEAAQHCINPFFSTQKDSESGAIDMSSERKKKRRKKKKNNDGNALRESGVDTNSEVTMESDARHSSEAQGSKLKSTEEKNVDGTVVNGCLKSKDDTVGQQKGADAIADDTVSETQNPKAKKKKRRKTKTMDVCDTLEITLATSMESGPVECMETAGVCEEKSKKRKRKKNKMSSADQETADMEVCDASENTLLATVESGSVECMLDHSNKEVLESCDKNAGKELVGEDRLNPGALKEKTDDEIGEPKQKRKTIKKKKENSCELSEEVSEPKQKKKKEKSCELSEEVSEPKQKKKKKKKEKSCELSEEVSESKQKKKEKSYELSEEVSEPKQKKKKKKKSCEDNKNENMDSKKDDDSVPKSEGELEFDGEKLDTQLSSSVLINDNMAHGVASQETGDLPRCSCRGQSTRKLVVFDLNGILADIARGNTGEFVPDGRISFRSVFKRPFVATFLDFCFEKFDVGIWSSRRIGLDYMTDIVMGNHARNLLFSFDQSICITTNYKTLENTTKPLFLKNLRTVWDRFGTCLSCGKRKYDETNTLLVDDSPDKALCNPPYTGIFPFPYQYTDREDFSLGPDGELRKYMERLVDAENVQKFVEENPIGQSAITETHESWSFYSRVIEAYKK